MKQQYHTHPRNWELNKNVGWCEEREAEMWKIKTDESETYIACTATSSPFVCVHMNDMTMLRTKDFRNKRRMENFSHWIQHPDLSDIYTTSSINLWNSHLGFSSHCFKWYFFWLLETFYLVSRQNLLCQFIYICFYITIVLQCLSLFHLIYLFTVLKKEQLYPFMPSYYKLKRIKAYLHTFTERTA